MDLSQAKLRVRALDEERRSLLGEALSPLPMIAGSLYVMRRRCGKSQCRCTRGELHVSWYLSRSVKGRPKLMYVGRVVPEMVETRVRRYKRYQKLLARVRKIDAEISGLLNALRNMNLREYRR